MTLKLKMIFSCQISTVFLLVNNTDAHSSSPPDTLSAPITDPHPSPYARGPTPPPPSRKTPRSRGARPDSLGEMLMFDDCMHTQRQR